MSFIQLLIFSMNTLVRCNAIKGLCGRSDRQHNPLSKDIRLVFERNGPIVESATVVETPHASLGCADRRFARPGAPACS
jgi:hypothetical protein